jgi:hypothetical protein
MFSSDNNEVQCKKDILVTLVEEEGVDELRFEELNLTDIEKTLPVELIPYLLVEADDATIFTCFQVCSNWNQYSNDNYFFQALVKKRFNLENYKRPKEMEWKWVFFSKLKLLVPTLSKTQYDFDSRNPANAVDDDSLMIRPYIFQHFAGEVGSKQIAGGIYEGEFKDKKRHGVGIYYWQTENPNSFQVRYCGDWVQGKRTGFGYCDWKSGSVYIGQFKNDQICGKGKFIWSNGDVYEGDFDENGNKSGYGEFRWKSGNKYEGGWELSKRSGHGKFTWYNGDVYEGEWLDDVKAGKGKLIWNNGNSFDGMWVNGQKEKGVMYEDVSKRTFEGNFDDGEVHMEFLHPDIIECIENKLCTSIVTGKKCYFQYLWQTNECSDRTHGVCMSCKNQCVEKNYTSLLEPNKRYLGGNFFCECGIIFGSSCRSMVPKKEHQKEGQRELLGQTDAATINI